MPDPLTIGADLGTSLADLHSRLAALDTRVTALERGNPAAPAVPPLPRSPAEILQLNGRRTGRGGWWNLGIGYRPSDPQAGEHIDTTPALLAAGWSHDPYFRATPDGAGVLFRVHCDGGRTSKGTKYPRSELRECTPDGRRAAWPATTGGIMSGRVEVLHSARVKPDVVVAQIHDGDDDTFQLRIEGDRWRTTVRGASTATGGLAAASSSDGLLWQVQVHQSRLRAWVGGDLVTDKEFTGDGHYFKTGAYAQANAPRAGLAASDVTTVAGKRNTGDDYFEVALYDLHVEH